MFSKSSDETTGTGVCAKAIDEASIFGEFEAFSEIFGV